MKDSLIFYITQYEAIKELTNEQLGRLFRAIFEKQLGNEVVLDNDIKIAFNFINNQLVVDNKKYEEKVAKLTANAKKGGAPKGNKNAKKQPMRHVWRGRDYFGATQANYRSRPQHAAPPRRTG